VNQAATKHPWLSAIIHRAAKHEATREELAKLGRVVGRLGRGEDVGEGPYDGLTPATSSILSNAVAGPSSQPSTLPAPAAPSTTVSNKATPKTTESKNESDDEDIDMKGPPQVGGGPMIVPSQVDNGVAEPLLPAVSRKRFVSKASQPGPSGTIAESTAHPSSPGTQSTNIPPIPRTATAHGSLDTTSSQLPQYPKMPPNRPVHEPPPPFLVIAFKEFPTEKYLIPLGSLSYISRVGGEYVTGPTPIQTASAPLKPPSSTVPILGGNAGQITAAEVPQSAPAALAPSEKLPIVEDVSTGKLRSRKSFGRGAKIKAPTPSAASVPIPEAPSTATPEVEVKEPPIEHTPIKPVLPDLPGTKPAPGAVLISTVIPSIGWEKPDWDKLSIGIPWGNPAFEKSNVKHEEPPTTDSSTVPAKATSEAAKQPDLLNTGATSFLPPEGPVQAVTIRLSDVSDGLWRRIGGICGSVEKEEIRVLASARPDLLDPSATDSQPSSTTAISTATQSAAADTPFPQNPARNVNLDHSCQPQLRETYLQSKRDRFSTLLRRATPRKFLHFRLSSISQPLIDATSDKWAPRPYPISTKPLYLASPPSHIIALPDNQPKTKKRGEKENEVEFEMPVSLDQLDERVEEGAKKAVGKKVGKLKGRASTGKVEGIDTLGRRHGRRSVAGRVCEGCGSGKLKVWRRGPGGTGTCEWLAEVTWG
jgi:hypothetical protein